MRVKKSFHRASLSATEVTLEAYSTLNGITNSHFPYEKMTPYANRPILLTASKSRKQNPVFYSRQMNPVCETPCFTHGPDQNSVPVCKNPTFTHGKLAPCVKRPILLTASKSCMQNPVFYSRTDNPVCKIPTFTHDPGQNGVPVCK